jgi:WD40 repeat protein
MPPVNRSGIVAICNDEGGVAGTGFFAVNRSNQALILTCSHVIQPRDSQVRGDPRPERVTVALTLTGATYTAWIDPASWRHADEEDVAVLQIEDGLPTGAEPLPLGSSAGTYRHLINTFGYPNVQGVHGIPGTGEVLDQLDEAGQIRLVVQSDQITTGYSGAAAWDEARKRVIGVIVGVIRPDERGQLRGTVLVTPIETYSRLCEDLRPSDICPYVGLEPFDESRADVFKGREQIVNRLVGRLKQGSRFVALLGPSGCGKSSLIHAGLIPALREESTRWGIIVVRPGTNPGAELERTGLEGSGEDLAAAARRWLDRNPGHDRLLVVMDQGEQLLISCEPETRADFASQIALAQNADVPLTILLCLRDEFRWILEDQVPELGRLVSAGRLDVSWVLSEENLNAIVRVPAESLGWRFEDNLVETIVAEILDRVEGDPRLARSTILPLLEVALQQLWEQPPESRLTFDAYARIGRVTGALTLWADRAYYSLPAGRQPLASDMLLDLVQVGDETQGIPDNKRRRLIGDLCWDERDRAAVRSVVDHLVASRLLVTFGEPQAGRSSAEIIHDALFREWNRLHEALRNTANEPNRRALLRWRQAIDPRVRRWAASHKLRALRSRDELLRGSELDEAEAWLARRGKTLGRLRRSYIRASRAQRRREERLWRRIAASLAAGLAVMAVMAVMAWRQWSRAQLATEKVTIEAKSNLDLASKNLSLAHKEQTARAGLEMANRRVQENLTLANRNLAQFFIEKGDRAWLDRDAFTSQILFGRSLELDDTPGTRRRLLTSRARGARLAWTTACRTGGSGSDTLVFSHDGRRLVSADRLHYDGQTHTLIVWDTGTGREVARLRDAVSGLTAAAFHPDGKRVVTAGADALIQIWDVQDEKELLRIRNYQGVIPAITVLGGKHPQIAAVLVSDEPPRKKVSLTTRKQENPAESSERFAEQLARKAASMVPGMPPDKEAPLPEGEQDEPGSFLVRHWDAETGELGKTFHGPALVGQEVALSDDGRWMAVGSFQGPVLLWDIEAEREVAVLKGHLDRVTCAAIAPETRRIATGSADHTIRIWDLQSGLPVRTLRGHAKEVTSITFAPDGHHLISASRDTTVRVWSLETGAETAMFWDSAESVALDGGGRLLASSGHGITIRDAATGRELLAASGHGSGVDTLAYGPDGTRIASAGDLAWVHVWDAATGRELRTFAGGSDRAVEAAAFGRDGTRLIGVTGNEILVWDVATGKMLSSHRNPKGAFSASKLILSSDGSRSALGLLDGTVQVLDVDSGKDLVQFSGRDADLEGLNRTIHSMAFSADGGQLAAGDLDGWVRLFNLEERKYVGTFGSAEQRQGRAKSLAFNPKGTWVVLGGETGQVQVWDARTRRLLRGFPGHRSPVTALAFQTDGRWLASGGGDGMVHLWDVAEIVPTEGFSPQSEEAPHPIFTLRGHDGAITSLAFGLDGSRLISGSEDRTVRCWVVDDPKKSPPGIQPVFSPDGKLMALKQLTSPTRVIIRSVDDGKEVGRKLVAPDLGPIVFSPDGQRLIMAEGQGIRSWPFRGGDDALTKLEGPPPDHSVRELSLDGSRFAARVSGEERRLIVWDTASGKLIKKQNNPSMFESYPLGRVALSPDGRTVAWSVAHTVSPVTLLDLTTKKVADMDSHNINSILGFDRFGRLFASVGSFDSIIRMWEVRPRRKLWTVNAHSAFSDIGRPSLSVSALCFCPEHRWFAVNGPGGRVALWDIDAGELIGVLSSPLHGIDHLASSGDGRWLAASGPSGSCRLFDLNDAEHARKAPPGELMREIREETGLQVSETSVVPVPTNRLLPRDQIAPAPASPYEHEERGAVFAEKQNWDEAASEFAQAYDSVYPDRDDRIFLGYCSTITSLASSRTNSYRGACVKLVERIPEVRGVNDLALILWACALGPQGIDDIKPLIELAKRISDANPNNPVSHRTYGALLLRSGQLDEAISQFKRASEVTPNAPTAWLFLAMALQAKGKTDEAKQWLDKEARWLDTLRRPESEGDPESIQIPWNRALELTILRRQAEDLLEKDRHPTH